MLDPVHANTPFHKIPTQWIVLLLICGLSPGFASAVLARDSASVSGLPPYQDPSRVLVVYRNNSADLDHDGVGDSQQLAFYYAAKRTVPLANVLGLTISVPSNSYILDQYIQFYTDMVIPIQNRLALLGPDTIDIILLAGNLPTAVRDGNNLIRSVDSALMGINTLS